MANVMRSTTTSASMLAEREEVFNPRLRLDISSGRQRLRAFDATVDSLSQSHPKLKSIRAPSLCAPSNGSALDQRPPSPGFERAIALMQGRHTQEMHDRHIAALGGICRQCAQGFYMHDIGNVEILLGGAARQLRNGHSEYVPVLCELLRVLSLPLRKNKSNDDLRYELQCADLIRTASSLLRLGVPPLSLETAEMLLQLISPANDTPPGQPSLGRISLQAARAQQLVAQSGATQNLLAVLAADAVSAPMVTSMRVLRVLSKNAPTAQQILRAEHLQSLFALLKRPLGEPILTLAVEVIWNLLDTEPAEAAARVSGAGAVPLLVDLFHRAAAPGVREVDTELRNELMVIATRIAQGSVIETLPSMLEHGFLAAASAVLDADALAPPFARGAADAPPPAGPRIHLGPTNRLDFELLQLTLNLFLVLTSAEGAAALLAPALAGSGLVAHLIAYLGESRGRWEGVQLTELRRLSLALLSTLTAEESLIAGTDELGVAVGSALGFLTPGGDRALRDGALRLLIGGCTRTKALQDTLGDAGVVKCLIDLVLGGESGASSGIGWLSQPSWQRPGASDPLRATTSELLAPCGLSSGALQDVLLSLSLLCSEHGENQKRFGDLGGVSVLLPLLAPQIETRVLLSAVECLWSAVAPSEVNTVRLVGREGVLQLLSCLDKCPFAPRAQLLAALADLLRHAPAVAQCQQWRSGAVSAVGVLLRIWREEEARLGGASGSGVLRSTARPLSTVRTGQIDSFNASLRLPGGEEGDSSDSDTEGAGGSSSSGGQGAAQPNLAADGSCSCDASDVGATTSRPLPPMKGPLVEGLGLTTFSRMRIQGRFDGLGTTEASLFEQHDLRAKVYAVLAQLNFETPFPLSANERALLAAAKEYALLCSAEAWHDVAEEVAHLPNGGPIEADAEFLKATLAGITRGAEALQSHQCEIQAEGRAEEAEAETALLASVRVLRDGPMGQLRGDGGSYKSNFRARLDAKNKVGEMVSQSHVRFVGPVADESQIASAAISLVEERLEPEEARVPADGSRLLREAEGLEELSRKPPMQLHHVPEVLEATAELAGRGEMAARVQPFMNDKGLVEGYANLSIDMKVPLTAEEKLDRGLLLTAEDWVELRLKRKVSAGLILEKADLQALHRVVGPKLQPNLHLSLERVLGADSKMSREDLQDLCAEFQREFVQSAR